MIVAVQRTVGVVLVYAILVSGLTWPLAANLDSHLPATFPGSDFDPLYSAWVLSWQSSALTRGWLDLGNANIYYPAPDSLYYGPVARGALPYFAPTFLLSGNPTLALNLMLLISLTLCASFAHLVVWAWTRMHAAGLVSGVALLCNRWLLWTFVPAVPHISVLFYFPLIIFLAASSKLGRRGSLALLVFVTLQCMTDIVYVTPAVLAPLATLALFYMVRRRTRLRGWKLAVIVGVAALLVFTVHYSYLTVLQGNPNLEQQTNWKTDAGKYVLAFPGGLMGFLSPLAVSSLVPALVAGVAGLVLFRGWRGSAFERTGWRHAAFWTLIGVAISLPTKVRFGEVVYTLPPHRALAEAWLPLGGSLRLPERLRVAALMGLVLLAGLAFAELTRQLGLSQNRPKRQLVTALVSVLVCVVIYGQFAFALGQPRQYGPPFARSYPLREMPRGDSSVLEKLRTIGGPTLEAPIWPQKPAFPEVHAVAMYRSIFHRQPLLNGYSSYWPVGFVPRMRVAARLPHPDAVRTLRDQTGLAFVLVRLSSGMPVDHRLKTQHARWLEFAKGGGSAELQLIAADDELLLFQVAGAE